MQDGARLVEGENRHSFLIIPRLSVQFLEGLFEHFELVIRFKRDFELGKVDVLGVIEACEKKPIHDFRQHLVAGSDAAIGRDVEDDGMRRDLLVDGFQDDFELWVTRACGKTARSRGAQDVTVLDRKAKHLGKARFARTEEAGDPDRDSFMGLLRSLLILFQHLHEVLLYRVRYHILVDFGGDDVGVGLVNLDDLLDLPSDVIREY